jgi:hypothetical protein
MVAAADQQDMLVGCGNRVTRWLTSIVFPRGAPRVRADDAVDAEAPGSLKLPDRLVRPWAEDRVLSEAGWRP